MATYDVVARMLVQALNADGTNSFSANSTNEAYPDAAIQAFTLDGEADVVQAILEAPSHSRRAAGLTTSATVSSGAQIPSHPGRLLGVAIDGVWAESAPAAEVSRWMGADARVGNPLKLKQIEKVFAVTGDNRLLYAGGGSATVYFGRYQRPTFASYAAYLAGTMLAPDEYLDAVFFSAMKLIGHEGQMLGAMAAYYDRGRGMMAAIRGDSQPTLKAAQRALEE